MINYAKLKVVWRYFDTFIDLYNHLKKVGCQQIFFLKVWLRGKQKINFLLFCYCPCCEGKKKVKGK